MKSLNLASLKQGIQARIVKIEQEANNKVYKQLMNLGMIQGNVVEVVNSDVAGLILIKKENTTFGISKQLANNVFIQLV